MQENKTKHVRKNKLQDIEVRAIGKPSIEALTESEQAVFYTTLLRRIIELAGGEDK